MSSQSIVTGFPEISRIGPESGWKLVFIPVTLSDIFRGRKDPRYDADLLEVGKEQGLTVLPQGGANDLSWGEVERPNDALVFEEERVRARRKADEGFFPIDSPVYRRSSIDFVLLNEILDELLHNFIWILKKYNLVYVRHESLLLKGMSR